MFARVPQQVVAKKKALTANPLFAGVIVLTIMVSVGPIQPSASRNSSANIEIEIQKFHYINKHPAIVGIPIMLQKIHTYAFVMSTPRFSYLSATIPPTMADVNPQTDTTAAFRVPYSLRLDAYV